MAIYHQLQLDTSYLDDVALPQPPDPVSCLKDLRIGVYHWRVRPDTYTGWPTLSCWFNTNMQTFQLHWHPVTGWTPEARHGGIVPPTQHLVALRSRLRAMPELTAWAQWVFWKQAVETRRERVVVMQRPGYVVPTPPSVDAAYSYLRSEWEAHALPYDIPETDLHLWTRNEEHAWSSHTGAITIYGTVRNGGATFKVGGNLPTSGGCYLSEVIRAGNRANSPERITNPVLAWVRERVAALDPQLRRELHIAAGYFPDAAARLDEIRAWLDTEVQMIGLITGQRPATPAQPPGGRARPNSHCIRPGRVLT